MTGTPRTRILLAPLLTAAVYLACLVWQAPHTVHHFFEHDAEKQNECALGAAAERAPGVTVDAVSVAPVAAAGPPSCVAAPASQALFVPALPAPRAPPHPTA